MIVKPCQNIILKLENMKDKNKILSANVEERQVICTALTITVDFSSAKLNTRRQWNVICKCWIIVTENCHSKKRAKLRYCQGYKSEQPSFIQILSKEIVKTVDQKEAHMGIHKILAIF